MRQSYALAATFPPLPPAIPATSRFNGFVRGRFDTLEIQQSPEVGSVREPHLQRFHAGPLPQAIRA